MKTPQISGQGNQNSGIFVIHLQYVGKAYQCEFNLNGKWITWKYGKSENTPSNKEHTLYMLHAERRYDREMASLAHQLFFYF